MQSHHLEHLDDATLRQDLHRHVADERRRDATVIAHIAEFDARRLYLAEAFPSMFAYCVGELGYTEDAAYKRIQAARTARRFPRLYYDVAAGRLHLAAVCLLAPRLTPENVDELVSAATGRSKSDIEAWLAQRFVPTSQKSSPRALVVLVKPRVPVSGPKSEKQVNQLAPGQVDLPILAPVQEAIPVAAAPALYIARIPLREDTREKLRRAQDLLAHALPSGDLTEILDRALDALLAKLEARKHAAVRHPRTPVPRPARPTECSPPKRSRAIAARVRRAVWERDGGRCTFVSASGRRCEARRGLEYDHVIPFALGGESTVEGLRLRCRAHNQYEAERTFGVDHMRRKREAGRQDAGANLSRPGSIS